MCYFKALFFYNNNNNNGNNNYTDTNSINNNNVNNGKKAQHTRIAKQYIMNRNEKKLSLKRGIAEDCVINAINNALSRSREVFEVLVDLKVIGSS